MSCAPQSLEVRAELTRERTALAARMADIDRTLERLPVEDGADSPVVVSNGHAELPEPSSSMRAGSLASRIVDLLRQHPDGLRAPQIVKTLKTDKRTTIYAALYRFTKTGTVRATGARGKQRYQMVAS